MLHVFSFAIFFVDRSVLLYLFSIIEHLLYFFKCHGTLVRKRFMGTASALVFLRKNLSSGDFHTGIRKRNFLVQVHQRFSTMADAEFIASAHSYLETFLEIN